jgi:hypothetical protein
MEKPVPGRLWVYSFLRHDLRNNRRNLELFIVYSWKVGESERLSNQQLCEW